MSTKINPLFKKYNLSFVVSYQKSEIECTNILSQINKKHSNKITCKPQLFNMNGVPRLG